MNPPSPNTASALLPIVQRWADHIGEYALLLAAVATIVMALLELAKAITFVRLHYHKYWVGKFLGIDATAELVRLTVGNIVSDSALYDQPSDKMMGQIGAAAKVALDFPASYSTLYSALTRGVEEDAPVWAQFVAYLENPRTTTDDQGVRHVVDPPEDEQRRATRARARIEQSVTRKLDAFQLRIEYVWARSNQVVAVIGATVFLGVLLLPISTTNPLTYGFSCLTGGLISPLAKDVVVALSSLRTKWS